MRLGVDLGGSKIEIIALGGDAVMRVRKRKRVTLPDLTRGAI